MSNSKKLSLIAAEETVGWVLDFISKNLGIEDFNSRWKLSLDAFKYLRLWDVTSEDRALYTEPPKIDLKTLQMELSIVFETYLRPLLAGEETKTLLVFPADNLPPKAFLVADGTLFCSTVLRENLEKVAVANFLEALSFLCPISTNRFQKCEGCGRWFLPQGKRTRKARRFCSRACNLRETARRQRGRLKSIEKK